MKTIYTIIFLSLLSCSEVVEEKPRVHPLEPDSEITFSIDLINLNDNDTIEYGISKTILVGDLVGNDNKIYTEFIRRYVWEINGTPDAFLINTFDLPYGDIKIEPFNLHLGNNLVRFRVDYSNGEWGNYKPYRIYVKPISATVTVLSPNNNDIFNVGDNIEFSYIFNSEHDYFSVGSGIWTSDIQPSFKVSGNTISDKLIVGSHKITMIIISNDGYTRTFFRSITVNPISKNDNKNIASKLLNK